jgi:hypothetical protein
MADAGGILFGAIGRELFGFGQLFFIVVIMAAYISELQHNDECQPLRRTVTCTAGFTVVGTIVSLVFTLPRSMGNLSYYCVASFASIIACCTNYHGWSFDYQAGIRSNIPCAEGRLICGSKSSLSRRVPGNDKHCICLRWSRCIFFLALSQNFVVQRIFQKH